MLAPILLALAMTGQTYPANCPNGQCFRQLPAATPHVFPTLPAPPPAPVVSAPAYGWYNATIAGRTQTVWGYRDGAGQIRYYPEQNPHIVNTPAPTPTPPATPRADNTPVKPADMPGVLITDGGQSLNAGVDIEGLQHEAGQLHTNDRAFGEWFSSPKAEASPAMFALMGDDLGSADHNRKPKLPDLPPVRPTLISDDAAKFAVLAFLGAFAAFVVYLNYNHKPRP